MIPIAQDIEILEGQSIDFTVPVTDDDGPVNLDGGDLKFYITPRQGVAPVLTKTPSSAVNVISESLTTAESLTLGAGRYYYAFWVTLLGESTPVARGTLRIRNSTKGAL